jgi:hypothetical protein
LTALFTSFYDISGLYVFQNSSSKMAYIPAQEKRQLYLEIVEFDSDSEPFRQSPVNREAWSRYQYVLSWVGEHCNAEVQGGGAAAT